MQSKKLTKPEAFAYLQSISEFRDAVEIKMIHVFYGVLIALGIFILSFVWHLAK